MPFVKLDTSILDSSLWPLVPERTIFLTALLMAKPQELSEETPTLHPESARVERFTVPPGWYGFVAAASTGIIARAGLDRDTGIRALIALALPEAESRSAEWQGRRMVRIEGGYIVLNFMKYRDIDHSGAERARRYRQRQKQTGDVTPSRRDVTQAEAEAEAEAYPEKKERKVSKKSRTEAELAAADAVEMDMLASPAIKATWANWKAYRRARYLEPLTGERVVPWTHRAATSALRTLETMAAGIGEPATIRAVETCIDKRYLDIYGPSAGQSPPRSAPNGSAAVQRSGNFGTANDGSRYGD